MNRVNSGLSVRFVGGKDRAALGFWVAVVVLCLPVRAWAQNLVQNPGFEDGHSGWDGGQVVTDNCHGGSACLLVVDDSTTQSISASTADLIPVVQGNTYHVVVWVRAGQADQSVLVTLNQYDAQQQWLSGRNMDWPETIGQEWTKVERVVRAFDPDTAYVRLNLRPVRWTSGGELTGQAWFDDVVIEEMTEEETVEGDWLQVSGPVRLWQAPVEQKVRPNLVPAGQTVSATELHVEAARGEFEAVQLVLSPVQDDTLEAVELTDATGPGLLPASAWTLRRVAYVTVTSPTDSASFVGEMPDPLPLVQGSVPLTAGRNQALWLTLKVPADQPAGIYHASVRLTFHGQGQVEVPVRVRVWNFSLGQEHHLRTAYGLSMGAIARYHGLGGNRDLRRQVWRLYLQDFAAHRISPYNPVGDDGYGVTWGDWNWNSGKVVDDPAGSGSRVMEVEDQDDAQSISVGTSAAIPVDTTRGYVLTWRARTDGSHDYEVSVQQYDASDQWISGANVDFRVTGTGDWDSESRTIDPSQWRSETASVRIRLYAVPWTSDGAGLGRTWFDDVVFHAEGDQGNLVTNGDFEASADDIEVQVDFSAFDEAAAYAFDDLGMDSFRVRLPSFGRGSFQGSSPGHLLQWDWTDPEYEVLYGKFLGQLTAHLQNRGWLDKAYAYWFDEPQPDDYDFVGFGMDMLGRLAPSLKRLLTEEYADALEGKVDIWVPIMDRYGSTWAHARQQAGESVWWYVCTGPKAPYPNNFIDHPGIEHRIRFWMAFKEGIQGSLYWSVNYWTNDNLFAPPNYQDPWQDPASYSSSSGRNWGNGDGRLLYPPQNWQDSGEHLVGPTPSIRWELIRDGIEDYEYLWLLHHLRDRLAAERPDQQAPACLADTLDVPSSLVRSLTDYSGSGKALQAQRSLVAECIEELETLLPEPQGGDQDQIDGSVQGQDSGAEADAGSQTGGSSGGCGCRSSGSSPWSTALLCLALSLWYLRRRRQ